MTRVFPEPAPASTRHGPPRWWTAASCAGLRVAAGDRSLLRAGLLSVRIAAEAVDDGSEGLALLGDVAHPAELASRAAQRRRRDAERRGDARIDLGADRRGDPGVDHRQQLREPARLALDVDDARLVAEIGALRRRADRVAEHADRVDEAAFLRLRSGPDAPLRNGVDLLWRGLARRRDLAREVDIRVIDALLHQLG